MKAVVQGAGGVLIEDESQRGGCRKHAACAQGLHRSQHVYGAGDDGDDRECEEPERSSAKGVQRADREHPPIRMVAERSAMRELDRIGRLDEERSTLHGLEAWPVEVHREINTIDFSGP